MLNAITFTPIPPRTHTRPVAFGVSCNKKSENEKYVKNAHVIDIVKNNNSLSSYTHQAKLYINDGKTPLDKADRALIAGEKLFISAITLKDKNSPIANLVYNSTHKILRERSEILEDELLGFDLKQLYCNNPDIFDAVYKPDAKKVIGEINKIKEINKHKEQIFNSYIYEEQTNIINKSIKKEKKLLEKSKLCEYITDGLMDKFYSEKDKNNPLAFILFRLAYDTELKRGDMLKETLEKKATHTTKQFL